MTLGEMARDNYNGFVPVEGEYSVCLHGAKDSRHRLIGFMVRNTNTGGEPSGKCKPVPVIVWMGNEGEYDIFRDEYPF